MIGWVYVLANPAMPDIVKIGFTTKEPRARASDLYTTGVPQPFVVSYQRRVDDPSAAESRLHRAFKRRRVNPDREFFRVTPWLVRIVVWWLVLRGGL